MAASLAFFLGACSQRQVCEGTEGSCLDLVVEGAAEIERLRIDASQANTTPASQRIGTLSLSGKLPRHILVTPPPGVTADSLRSITVTGYSAEDLAYVADELPLSWAEGAHLTARVTLPAVAQAPQIDKIEPALGTSAGGQMVTISGRNFARSVDVRINGVEATAVSRISATEIRTVTPAQPGKLGSVDVMVTNQSTGQQATRAKAYSYFLGTLDIPAFSTVPVGIQPCGMASGDFDKDGSIDLAVANYASQSITILRGKGDGTFTQSAELKGANTYLVGPCSILALDLNKDGYLDLVAGNSDASHVSIFTNTGTGAFNPNAQTVSTETGPVSLVSADFDGDGNIDIATANSGIGVSSVSMLQGNGTGGLTLHSNYDVIANAKELTIGDFNGDMKPDIMALVGTGSAMALSYGRNTSSSSIAFAAASSMPLGFSYQALTVFDVDGDGDQDLLYGNTQSAGMVLQRGNGNGTFAAPESFQSCSASFRSIAVDVNNDQRKDLIAICNKSHSLAIHYAKNDGTFYASDSSNAIFYATDLFPRCAAAVDINKDGIIDLLSCNSGSNNIGILLGEANGHFRGGQQLPIFFPVDPYQVEVGDFNGDGLADIATGTFGSPSRALVSWGGMDGLFSPLQSVITGSGIMWLAQGDLNGGGIDDLVIRTGPNNEMSVLLGAGLGGFSPSPAVSANASFGQLLLRDVNMDGRLDLMTLSTGSNKAASVRLGNGDGKFKTESLDDGLVLTNTPVFFGTADLNNDGKLDYAFADKADLELEVRLGDGAGGFTPGATLTTRSGPSSLAIADFTGDGFPDIVATHDMDNSLLLFVGSGNGPSNINSKMIAVGEPQSHVAAADFDGDRNIDLLVTSAGSHKVRLFRGRGDGSFQLVRTVTTPRNPRWSTPADLDGDGKLDFVVANTADHTLSVFYNRSR